MRSERLHAGLIDGGTRFLTIGFAQPVRFPEENAGPATAVVIGSRTASNVEDHNVVSMEFSHPISKLVHFDTGFFRQSQNTSPAPTKLEHLGHKRQAIQATVRIERLGDRQGILNLDPIPCSQ